MTRRRMALWRPVLAVFAAAVGLSGCLVVQSGAPARFVCGADATCGPGYTAELDEHGCWCLPDAADAGPGEQGDAGGVDAGDAGGGTDAGPDACPPGTEHSDDACHPCMDGMWSPGGSASCEPWRAACEAGMEEVAAPSATQDRRCEVCADGTWSDGSDESVCTPFRMCSPGEGASPTGPTADRECTVCDVGWWSPGGAEVCKVWRTCGATEVQVSPGTPTMDTSCAPALQAKHVSAGRSHTCAILMDDTIACWGSALDGKLGPNGTESTPLPVRMPGLSGVRDLAAGGAHTCAAVGSSIRCWGSNAWGQLQVAGDSQASPSSIPNLSTPSMAGSRLVVSGERHSCAQHSTVADGYQIHCWGDAAGGKLGVRQIGTTTGYKAVIPESASLALLGAGTDSTCASDVNATGDAEMLCWGRNDAQMLTGALSAHLESPQVVPDSAFRTGVPGHSHLCRTSTGNVRCRGNNAAGQTNPASMDATSSDFEVASVAASWVMGGVSHTCAVFDRVVHCWGTNTHGQLGRTGVAVGPGNRGGPTPIEGPTDVEQLSTKVNHACVVDGENVVWCWGANDEYQAGGTGTYVVAPQKVRAPN